MRGQALVEFAIILPLMLVVILGGIGVGLLLLERMQLQHTANVVATFAATSNCAGALGRVPQVLGHEPDAKSCDVRGQLVEVTLRDSFRMIVPLVPLPSTIVVDARALVEPTPSP